ncbi:MAG: hypothetical protein A2487_00230 [Candidatus Raymondbacteria bacterium RifOxyC12_full_50_8]|uniref:Pseudouridine synthase RsuA/RluA-like domain-containing protein n=1 Tax=Candidatus Raymondbacteria bacterium RIFOXYD12_FULL_49_13 TaxID=1817890 RepID=A0A1F7FLE0_UNCRA|nr:MAG: hypothetical protein A2248_08740 [Candidatus Raymondbacteria bacterium RIFOXYA2_FULL_49_16]OGK07480.1 MAG: hypothetical protein A2519_20185 [Candidatus Raymondbacteria bacterium RIFOXYD12_FULL_49_13]OGK07766.1 MAG: hypothetical protein A2487_00230 [Candidatus Raymondbacteria bacterium RifOxyC12_full_50_8]OGP43836.1 MAG: hypothetical protein A2324_01415 [Candidatus Raymondbacteria bacterium RIFOXYB2_FULL_49_35]
MITLLYEDSDIIAVEKPEGIAAIPERKQEAENLLALVSKQCNTRLFIVHRIDKEVSGVMLFAKNAAAHKIVNDQFAERKVKKLYQALLLGNVVQEQQTIKRSIRQFGSGRMGVDDAKGKPCTTNMRVIKRCDSATLVEASPVTGRRHQIRVHFYSIGHPVAGDLRYGDRNIQSLWPRLMLHACSIGFTLPSGKPLVVESPLSSSFEEALAAKCCIQQEKIPN